MQNSILKKLLNLEFSRTLSVSTCVKKFREALKLSKRKELLNFEDVWDNLTITQTTQKN